jgi:hypothetical protein
VALPIVDYVYSDEVEEQLKKLEEIENYYKNLYEDNNGIIYNNFYTEDLGYVRIKKIRENLLKISIPKEIRVTLNGDSKIFVL